MKRAWMFPAALAAAAIITVAGCYEEDGTNPPPVTGTQVLLTDAPFPFDSVESVNIHVVSISASTGSDTTSNQPFVTITSPDKRFDLLELQQGKTALVGAGDIPAGEYRAVRMVIDTHDSDIQMQGGRLATIDWGSPSPSGEIVLNALVESPVQVPEGGADIVIDFDVGRSFAHSYGTAEFTFLPVIRAVDQSSTGTISGVITGDLDGDGTAEPIRNAAITVYPGDSTSLALWGPVATGHSDSAGVYRIGFLVPGVYTLEFDPLSQVALSDRHDSGLEVTAGHTLTKNITLPTRDLSYIYLEGSFVLDTGEQATLIARVGDAQGRAIVNPSVTWASSVPSVATITGSGDQATVQALQPGVTIVSASSGGRSTEVSLYVFAAGDSAGGGAGGGSAQVASVTLSPPSTTVAVGDSLGFFANVLDANGHTVTGSAVTWSVSDSTVVWITGRFGTSLILRAAKPGSATITASAGSKSGSAVVTVEP
jgi:hypothetical protein